MKHVQLMAQWVQLNVCLAVWQMWLHGLPLFFACRLKYQTNLKK